MKKIKSEIGLEIESGDSPFEVSFFSECCLTNCSMLIGDFAQRQTAVYAHDSTSQPLEKYINVFC
jgi:hypothetical protein